MLRVLLISTLAGAALLSGCAKRTQPPGDAGVCFHVVQKDGVLKYNRLTENVPTLERCAANLEAMRIKFLRMGGNVREITGAYQGNFIFVEREGVFTSPTLEQHGYLALVRTGDGRLAIPGA